MMDIKDLLETFYYLLAVAVGIRSSEPQESRSTLHGGRPYNIAYRGSSGALPENTVMAYQLAIQQGIYTFILKVLVKFCTFQKIY